MRVEIRITHLDLRSRCNVRSDHTQIWMALVDDAVIPRMGLAGFVCAAKGHCRMQMGLHLAQ
jgi:hypothetical protein